MKCSFAVLALSPLLLVGACTSEDGAKGSSSSGQPALEVTAAFYPLQWASQRVGGNLVEVTGLTKPGAEPHDLELTPKAVAQLAGSDVVVYLKGFQPAVDEAVQTQTDGTAFDVTKDADLTLVASAEDHGAEDSSHATPGNAGRAKDPHFWLDPLRLAKVGTALSERFAAADPGHAPTYRANAAALASDLRALDRDFKGGLSTCASKDLVTGHTAFGYLAARYGFTQEGIAGVSPDAEPDAAAIRTIVEHVRQHHVSTVYSETLVSPALAQTIAREAGARVAVLDPIEGLTDSSAGDDYLEVMRSNLDTLRQGQQCH